MKSDEHSELTGSDIEGNNEPIHLRLSTLELEKFIYPGGEESANYYSHVEDHVIKHHFNKFYEEAYVELPDNWEKVPEKDISYRDDNPSDFNSDINDPLENILKLDICNFPINPDKKIDEHLQQDDIKEMLHNPNWILDNLIIISPPRTGKTSQMIDYLISKKKKFIFLVPLRLQVEQLSTDHDKLGYYLPGKSKNANSVIDNEPYIVTTYNSFLKINELIKNKWDYYLIIDEFHKLVSDSNYRTESLINIYNKMFKYQRFIGLTGTPYGCINKSLLKYNVKLLNINLQNKFALVKKGYNIIKYKQTNSTDNQINPLFYKYIKENISEGINIVFVNNMKILDLIENQLRAEKVIVENQSRIITSDTKEDPEVLEIFKQSKVPDNYKVILATSVMSTGINLKGSNFNNVFIYDESNLIEVIQFIYRFREGINTIYDFVPNESLNQKKFDFEKEFDKLVDTYQDIVDKINDVIPKENHWMHEHVDIITIKNIWGKTIWFDRKAKLNENFIRWNVLSKLHNRAILDTEIRTEYLKLYGIDNINKPIIDLSEPEFNTECSKLYNKINRQKTKEIVIIKLLENTSEVISYFHNSIKSKNPRLFNSKRIYQLIEPIDATTKTILKNIFSNLDNATIKNIISEFLFFYSTGVSKETAIEMLQE